MQRNIDFDTYPSPVGPLLLGMSAKGLAYLLFRETPPDSSREQWSHAPGCAQTCIRQLDEYFARERHAFDLPLDLKGTDFQRRCWQELLRIPYGQTVSYGELARKVGSPGGFRAVGQANHHNPVAIIVPCHRVLNHNGKLGGYGGGLDLKERLLALERGLFF